ncbi:hypothetical protein [uncultured Psychroserpens sp.]|nr:hypothetical protein [uncultured Psychroserpens sp.]
MASFSQCSSAQKLQKEAPVPFGEVYCQNWNAGVQGGGSGLNIYIPIGDHTIALDSVYFRGRVSKLEMKQNSQLLVGSFRTDNNSPKDIVMSSDSKEEYANQIPGEMTPIPFELKDDECVVSYKQNNKTLYYKILNVKQKEPLNYPSAPPNKN